MATPITIPRLGWNMDEGVFVGWLQSDGATVQPGLPLFSLESEKATEEVECLDAGILRIPADAPRPGDRVEVGRIVGYVLKAGEPMPVTAPSTTPSRKAGQARALTVPPNATPPGLPFAPSGKVSSSPRARRLARELGIDWRTLQGSGRTGRVREQDVRAAVMTGAVAGEEMVVALTSIRRTIAERMTASHLATAPVTLTTQADATRLVLLRNRYKAAGGPIPSCTDFFVKLTASALAKHPQLNARWEKDRIIVSARIHIGVAVDTETGLVVPVVRDVPSLRVQQLAACTQALIDRAQHRKLTAQELQGGTFTVTNLGSFGIDAFTPIIHQPQCAILGVGRIRRVPAVVGDQIVIRDQVTLSLTFDHRIVDGAPAARFLQTLCALIGNPDAECGS